MAEEEGQKHHHHHLFHHKKEEEEGKVMTGEDYEKEQKHHKHKEHLGEMGAAAAGAFALVCIYLHHISYEDYFFGMSTDKKSIDVHYLSLNLDPRDNIDR